MKPSRITAAIVTIACILIGTPAAPAAAGVQLIEPGDRIETASSACTLGWAYIGADKHTYAVTAGHCSTAPDETVRNVASGASGRFVNTIIDPPGIGGADYGLIDFGLTTLPARFIVDQPAKAGARRDLQPDQHVCRYGIATGTQCGTITRAFGHHQYLTIGMTPTVGGDSGGPVWTTSADGSVRVVGIWLGGRTTFAGGNYGRFAALDDAQADLASPQSGDIARTMTAANR
ncbi:serine protease [Mycobacterium sp. DSM 3803]|nr:serine protease [Mycobacterium sp. DSM 3803]